MPQCWVDVKPVITVWLVLTLLIFGLSIVTVPLGCVLAVVGSFLYFQRKGTEKAYAGKHSARLISTIALAAWIYDMMILNLLIFSWTILVFNECKDLDTNICNFRRSVGYFLSAQMCMIVFHAIVSFAAYVRMRDCYKDVSMDEKEELERFVDLEQQVFEEFKQRREEEMKRHERTKKKSHGHKKKEHKHERHRKRHHSHER
eukprot:g8116.t1